MPTPLPIVLDDFSGGVNLGVPAHRVPAGQVASAVNYFNSAKGLVGRGGARSFAKELYGNDRDPYPSTAPPIITGIHMWSRVGPPRETALVIGSADSIAVLVDDAWVELPRGGSSGTPRYQWSDEPWHFTQYNGVVYGFRRGVGMRRITPNPLFDLTPGIAAPSAVPTVASGGVGATTGAFYVAYAFRNSRTGQMSNLSPASLVFNAAANTLVVSNIQVSDNPQVDSRRVFVTLPNQTGAYFRWFDIPNNVNTTADARDVDVLLLGELASTRNTPPPNGLIAGVIWQERLWATDGKYLYCSEVGQPESMPAFNVLSVFPDDGQEITGLCADENRLYVGRTSSVIYLTGSLASLERHTLDGANGVASHGSMKLVDGKLVWFTGTDFVASEGGSGRSLTTGEGGDGTRLKLYLDNLSVEDARKTVAEVWPNDNLYIFLGRFSQTREEDAVDAHPHTVFGSDMLALNYQTGAWWPWRYRELPAHAGGTLQPSMAIKTVVDADGQEKLLVSYRTAVNRLLTPSYGHDDLVKIAGGSQANPPERGTYVITYSVVPKELGGAGATFISKSIELTGQQPWFSELTAELFRGGRYLTDDRLRARVVEYEDSSDPLLATPPVVQTRVNLASRTAVPRLCLQLTWVPTGNTLNPNLSAKPPRLDSVVWDAHAIRRRLRPI